jgi:16S rRNA (uracil1498-N3)-methyltransferase
MNRYYIPHELKVGDITHLSDKDSQRAISSGTTIEDPIVLLTYTSIFNGVVTYIEKKSVEVEVLEYVGKRDYSEEIQDGEPEGTITILQSISSPKKFGYFLEKCVEIGVTRVIPLLCDLSLISKDKFEKDLGLYRKVVSDATEQSRSTRPTVLEKIETIPSSKNIIGDNNIKICLATEVENTKSISEYLTGDIMEGRNIVVAIGPESGWSVKDIDNFKTQGYTFLHLDGNMLRTETVGIVIASIIKFVQGKI